MDMVNVMKNSKIYNKAFLTGCDHKTEWMLPWFVENFRLTNPSIPLIFANFGITKDGGSEDYFPTLSLAERFTVYGGYPNEYITYSMIDELFIAENILISKRSSITSLRLVPVICIKGTKLLLPKITS